MALEKPEEGYVWLHVPLREAVEVVVCGEVHTWWSHWIRQPPVRFSQAVRCVGGDGRECAWCDYGSKRQCRYVFPVRVEAQLRLVELGRVQYPVLAMCEQEGGLIGRRLRLFREYAAKNAPIQLLPTGRDHVSSEQRVDLADYVENLGVVQLKLLRVPQNDFPSKPRSGKE